MLLPLAKLSMIGIVERDFRMALKPGVGPFGHVSAEADLMLSVVFGGHVLGSKYHLGRGKAIRVVAEAEDGFTGSGRSPRHRTWPLHRPGQRTGRARRAANVPPPKLSSKFLRLAYLE